MPRLIHAPCNSEVSGMRITAEKYNLSRDEIQVVIDQWIFNARDRNILSDRLLDGTTYERLAEKYDLSTQQTKTIVKKAMARISAKFDQKTNENHT